MKKIIFIAALLHVPFGAYSSDFDFSNVNLSNFLRCSHNESCPCTPCLCGDACDCPPEVTIESNDELFERIRCLFLITTFAQTIQSFLYPAVKECISHMCAQLELNQEEKQWLLSFADEFNEITQLAKGAERGDKKFRSLFDEKKEELNFRVFKYGYITALDYDKNKLNHLLASDQDLIDLCIFEKKFKQLSTKMDRIHDYIVHLDSSITSCDPRFSLLPMIRFLSQALLDSIQAIQE